jgi:hypothetical protein
MEKLPDMYERHGASHGQPACVGNGGEPGVAAAASAALVFVFAVGTLMTG